jgi:subtilase family serine protease
MRLLLRSGVGVAICLAMVVSAQARVADRRILPGHVPRVAATLQPIGDLPSTNRLRLALGLPLRNPDALRSLLLDLYNPGSPRFHQFLKPREFADQFGPREEDYNALIAFALAHHFRIVGTHSNRLLLDVTASTAEVGETFHVNMKLYRHPSEPRAFFAPDSEPSTDPGIPLLHISGLDNLVLPRPVSRYAVRRADGPAGQDLTGSGPNGSFLPVDLRAAYAPGVTLTGAGQSVALVAFDAYYTNDILNYESMNGIAPVPVTNVLIDGFNEAPQGGEIEVATDIEMAVAMAPGLSQVLVYEASGADTSVNDDLLNQIAVDDLANQASCSWLFEIDSTTDQIFQEMAAQGQSFFDACGDSGAYYADMPPKEGDPFITVVGGSILTTSGPGGTWQSEIAWPAGSGGISAAYAIPYWQQTVNMSSNQGSTVWRNVPDVALVAQGLLVIFDNGVTNPLSGTSCSAPLWAGFVANVNQQGAQNGRPPVGFLNPAIYGLGQGSLYGSCFHDIRSGSNRNAGSTNKFFAEPGFDLCTGWGTPAGQALIDALAPPDSLVILPPGGMALAVTNNNTAAPAADTLVLTNAGAGAIAWGLASPPSWIEFSASNGIVPAGSATTLTVTTSQAATNLAVGGYGVDLPLSNLTAGVAHAVPIFLEVSDPLILTPATGMVVNGPVGGPFSVTSQEISLSNASAASLNWTVTSGSGYLNVAPGAGMLVPGQTAGVMATLAPAASRLLISSQNGGISFADSGTGYTQSLPFSLAVGNGGFETGDFSDWTFAGDGYPTNFVADATDGLAYIHSGEFAAVFGQPSNLATVSQTVPTTEAQTYALSFWLDNPVGGNPNEFEAAWNGSLIFSQTNLPKMSWTNMEFVLTATAAATPVEFFFMNEPDAFGLDDVRVTAIVPPAFTSVTAANTNLILNWTAIPEFSYRLQYTTNLAAPVWTNSGCPVTATNTAAAAAAALSADSGRFYRVVLELP